MAIVKTEREIMTNGQISAKRHEKAFRYKKRRSYDK